MELDQELNLDSITAVYALNEDIMCEDWQKLGIHNEACTHHTTRFPDATTELWKNVIWMLEDTLPGGCRDIVVSLMQVPLQAQREFIRRASSAFVKPHWRYDAKLKNFGVPYYGRTEAGLLIGQMYENWDAKGLANNAVECYGLEFGGRFSHCIVLSFDMLGKATPTVLKLRRTDLWPKMNDLDEYIRANSDGGGVACSNR